MLATDTPDFVQMELSARIGTTIRTNARALLSGKYAETIRELLERRGVLVFPQINLSDEQQIAFTKTLGRFGYEDGDGVYKISMDKRENPRAEYLQGTFYWHIDGTMSKVPIRASILSARRIASEGGNTEFANTYAAYEDLPETEKRTIDGLQVVHTFASTQLHVKTEPRFAELEAWKSVGQNTLPLVWRHRSGRKSLVIGSTSQYVVDMNPLDGLSLLVRLRDWATQPQFVYSHKWQVGDMVIWDNTGTMHRASPFPPDCGRLMHRTKLEGEEPFH